MTATPGDALGQDQAGRAELLWALDDQPAKEPRRALSVRRIADAAVEIADAEGLSAVSMQRVASSLQVTKMALYRHVASKAELIAVMIETAVSDGPDLSNVTGGWRAKLEEWAEQMRQAWRRHPWLPQATAGERVMGPKEIGWTESAVGALDGTGLDGGERMDAVFLLSGHIRNTHAAALAGTQPWTVDRQLSPSLTSQLHQYQDRFPALVAAVSSSKGSPSDNGWTFGLHRILDGLATLIEQRTAAP